ncbi:MAG TPA: hypothetical protein VMU34_08715, partial [Mycobacterium sp.]|nr:hypothetical protein [Mycobacterium sp.]
VFLEAGRDSPGGSAGAEAADEAVHGRQVVKDLLAGAVVVRIDVARACATPWLRVFAQQQRDRLQGSGGRPGLRQDVDSVAADSTIR